MSICSYLVLASRWPKKRLREKRQPQENYLSRGALRKRWTAIVEGAARILEKDGFEKFNTNAVAEKAGVSIGSLYQYFPNKDVLLAELMERELAPFLAASEEILKIGNCESA